jgi:phage terminase Nu1 subunit (DNA packaging protein)
MKESAVYKASQTATAAFFKVSVRTVKDWRIAGCPVLRDSSGRFDGMQLHRVIDWRLARKQIEAWEERHFRSKIEAIHLACWLANSLLEHLDKTCADVPSEQRERIAYAAVDTMRCALTAEFSETDEEERGEQAAPWTLAFVPNPNREMETMD